MCESIVHRGPDDSGEVAFGPMALAMRRLSIIDLSPLGHQPMSNEDGSVWVVYNGEIYNYRELQDWLEKRGHRLRSRSDTEVIVHLYEELGADCVTRLRGMFAFAIWDERRAELFVARDHLGIKPLYYADLPNAFVFASEIKALLASGLVSRSVDVEALDQYLAFGSVPAPSSLVSGVKALPPGHAIVARRGEVRAYRYWDLPPERAPTCSRDEAVMRVKQLLEESVRLHQVGDVPIGAFLSGGIDSTAVVGLMARTGTQQVRTFAVGFSDAPSSFDELPIARLAARTFETEHSEHIVDGDQVLAALPQLIWYMDQPSADGTNTFFVSRAVHEAGLKVALSGLGGDELFGGYGTYEAVPRWAWASAVWGSLPQGMKEGVLEIACNVAAGAGASSDRLRKVRDLATVRSAVDLYALARMALWPKERERLLSRSVNEMLGRPKEPGELLTQYTRPGESLWHMVTRLEMRSYMGHRLLRDTDAMSMAHSLEVRVPLLDKSLVEYVAGLPASYKGGHGRPKYLLTAALEGILPDEIVRRKKQGFAFPMGHWMARQLRPVVEEALSPESVRRRGLFDEAAVSGLYRSFQSGARGWWTVWQLVVLELWLRQYIDDAPFGRANATIPIVAH